MLDLFLCVWPLFFKKKFKLKKLKQKVIKSNNRKIKITQETKKKKLIIIRQKLKPKYKLTNSVSVLDYGVSSVLNKSKIEHNLQDNRIFKSVVYKKNKHSVVSRGPIAKKKKSLVYFGLSFLKYKFYINRSINHINTYIFFLKKSMPSCYSSVSFFLFFLF